jgi:hypothetical protein
MTIFDRRRQLQQQIAQLPDDQLTQVEQYILVNQPSTTMSKSISICVV